jgi:hypothetical protein
MNKKTDEYMSHDTLADKSINNTIKSQWHIVRKNSVPKYGFEHETKNANTGVRKDDAQWEETGLLLGEQH